MKISFQCSFIPKKDMSEVLQELETKLIEAGFSDISSDFFQSENSSLWAGEVKFALGKFPLSMVQILLYDTLAPLTEGSLKIE